MVSARGITALGCAVGLGCVPSGELEPSRVDEVRVVAVVIEPPEATPGETDVRYRAVVAGPEGTLREPAPRWSFCARPRGPGDPTSVSAACAMEGPWITDFAAMGLTVAARTPGDACRTVGPELPPVGQDRRPQRAPDPDLTGGYYLPVRLQFDARAGFATDYARLRIRCSRPDLPTDVARELGQRQRANRNPALTEVVLQSAAGARTLPLESEPDDAEVVAAPGQGVTLEARWTQESTERYLRPAIDGNANEEISEVLELTWLSNAGRFSRLHTAATGSDSSVNVFTPDAGRAGVAVVWVVLRDGRGGTDVRALRLTLR